MTSASDKFLPTLPPAHPSGDFRNPCSQRNYVGTIAFAGVNFWKLLRRWTAKGKCAFQNSRERVNLWFCVHAERDMNASMRVCRKNVWVCVSVYVYVCKVAECHAGVNPLDFPTLIRFSFSGVRGRGRCQTGINRTSRAGSKRIEIFSLRTAPIDQVTSQKESYILDG